MQRKVLIIDDDTDLSAIIQKYLEKDQYEADVLHKGAPVMPQLEKEKYALIILDIMLPDLDGFSIVQLVREQYNTPILMLTAKNEESDKIKGLSLGADDYLTKPFSMGELVARVHSLVRRFTSLNPYEEEAPTLSFSGDLIISMEEHSITKAGKPVDLTSKEFALLVFLAKNKGRIFTRQQIYSNVWQEEFDFDDSNLMSFISKLRKKIETDPQNPFYIQTVRGVGYRFNKEA